MIEMEKLKLISMTMREGISEKDIDKILEEDNVPDFDFDNFKRRMGIKAKKMTYGQKVAERKENENQKQIEHDKQ